MNWAPLDAVALKMQHQHQHQQQASFGPRVTARGAAFSLWAPDAEHVHLILETADGNAGASMTALSNGWHTAEIDGAKFGDRYRFALPDGQRVPDPASHFNPDDVHGASQLVDPLHAWRCDDWRGRPWSEAVLYEMHVGTFTSEGTFKAAQARLQDLKDLGITAIEMMPVADFPGERNWGYDGVLHFAPDAAYGTPSELRDFIDAAHELGLMVLLDVVYNHFGPEGNYLPTYCSHFFNPAHQTPWGAAINFDGPHSRHVRDFFVQNALYWIKDFRCDGLRMDAVHAIRDDSPQHIVDEICEAIREGPGKERHVHIVLENENNSASLLERRGGGPVTATAQWNDDIHHAVHVLATGEKEGHYADYQDRPLELFGRALAQGFIYQGQASEHLKGKHRGEPSGHLPGSAFVSFLQTHDQVGNRALGERIHALGHPAILRAARTCILLSPHVPMFFMGEEYAASTPFQFFCDFGPELADAVTQGRRKEFSHFAMFSSAEGQSQVPDPNAVSTFLASKLDWTERQKAPHADWLAEATQLLALRQSRIVPLLAGQQSGGEYRASGDGTLFVRWNFKEANGGDVALNIVTHFGNHSATVDKPAGQLIYATGTSDADAGAIKLSRGAVRVSLEKFVEDKK